EIGDGVSQIAFTLPGQAAIAIGFGEARAEFDGAAEIVNRGLHCAARIMRPAESVVRLGQPRVQFQSAVVVGQGPLKVAFSLPDYPATKMRFRKARRDAQGAVEIGDRAVIIPLYKLRHAARIEGHGRMRINNPDAFCSRRIIYPPGSIRAISCPELAALQTRG